MRRGSKLSGLRGGLLAGAAAALLTSTGAYAQDERQRVDVPAGEAASQIQRLAIQSRVQVIAPDADLAGVRTRAVSGNYTPLEALRNMLAGTGLEAAAGQGGTIIVRRAAGQPGQSAATAPSDAAEQQQEAIVITGSRIERAGFDTLQAALSTEADEIRRRAYTNALQALQDTPGFAPAASSPVQASQGNLGIAQSFSNFFGIGSQRTLTLVNGRRFVSSNTVSGSGGATAPGSQVDLNLIPVGLIDRIETVAIGGAPVYGSDAIAGTVNVILRTDYEGLELTGQVGFSDEGDALTYTARGLYGLNFDGGRGNVVLGAEYTKQEGFVLSRRFPFRFFTSSGNTNPTDGISSQLVVNDLRYAVLTEGGLPYRVDAAPQPASYIRNSAGEAVQFDQNGDLVPFRLGTPFFGSSSGPYPIFRDGGDGVNPGDHFSLLSPNERYLFNLVANYDLTNNLNVFVEGSYAHTSGTKLTDLFQFAAPNVLGGPTLVMNVDNPFLTQQARDILVANGVTTFLLNRNFNDIADREPATTVLDVYRIVAGFRGDLQLFGNRWNWDIAYNYGRSENVSTFNQINRTRFLNAIDVIRDGSGNIVCRSGGNCVPLNLFGENNFSDEAAAYVIDRGIGTSINTLQSFTANLGGDLPFGIADPISLSVGFEHRREFGSFDADPILEGGLTLLGGSLAFADLPPSSFNTDEVYGEALVPLISDEMGVPVLRAAQLEGALRYVDHSSAGGDLTWSIGGRVQPRLGGIGDGLVLRGVYTRAIRAPAITELFVPSTPVARNAADVCAASRVNSGPNPAVRLANCTAALAAVGGPAPASFVPTTSAASPFGTVSGNPDLGNEIARSWSAGFVYQPPAIRGLRLSVDYSRIRLRGAISRFTLVTAQAACYDSPNFPNEPACASFRRLTAAEAAAQPGPARIAGDIANGYSETYFNTASFDFAGIIAAANYSFTVPNILSGDAAGTIRLGLNAFYIDKFRTQTSSGSPVLQAEGTLGSPRWRINGRIGYAFDPIDLDVQILWTDSTVGDRLATIENTPINNFPSYTQVNTALGVQVLENLNVQFSVRNLLNASVPFEAQVTRSFSVYDPIGRTYTMRAAVRF
jgi:iron complex outermembrane receptor protein